jgi:hypothetical protein
MAEKCLDRLLGTQLLQLGAIASLIALTLLSLVNIGGGGGLDRLLPSSLRLHHPRLCHRRPHRLCVIITLPLHCGI